jgi:hypothetical protein
VLAMLMLIFTISMLGFLLRVQIAEADVTRYAGVSVGDWWKYDANFTWLTTPYNDNWCNLMNNTDWIMCNVLDVSGTNVTFQELYHLRNGTERSVVGGIDVASGNSNASSSYMICPYQVISANLSSGDPIFTDVPGFSQWKINTTKPRTYAGTLIETNIVNISSPSSMWVTCFAKDTGILTELEASFTTGYYVHLVIVESPVFPEFPSLLILPIFMTITFLFVIVYKIKRTKYSIT